MKILEMLGLSRKRASWQELVGLRPHMIDEQNVDAGFGRRKSYEVLDGIAIVDVRGVLVNDEDYWDGWGLSTYDRIAGEAMGAADDDAVEGILLRVNSPGGETDKAFETASKITSASKKKPVWAVADTSAYSAGYLLAASGSRVYVSPQTGGVGSIGVYTVHMDLSGMLDDMGVKATFISAGKGKTDGHPYKPLSADAKARIQASVDKMYGLFVDHVSAQRGMPGGSIREFGAALFSGQDAIDAGLADKIGDTETALLEMRDWLDSRKVTASAPGFSAEAATAAEEVIQMAGEQETAAVAPNPAAAAAALGIPQAQLEDDFAAANYGDPVVVARQATADRDRIIALCATHGRSAKQAQEYIAAGQTPEQVGAAIADARATESEATEIVSQIQPHSAAAAEAASPLIRAAEREAERHARQTKGR